VEGTAWFVECEPVDVTTLRTTPRMGLGTYPFAMPARVNGGVLRMVSSWRSAIRGTPNRCVSASRPVGPCSISRYWESPLKGDLPPPRAQENVAEKAQPRPWVSAEMGRSTDADGERECAETSPPLSLHRPLDKPRFIDGPSFANAKGGVTMIGLRDRLRTRALHHRMGHPPSQSIDRTERSPNS
jgi:hypothetical protein